MADIVFLDPQFRAGAKPTPASERISRIALIGNFPPRRCGIATFTADTRDALLATQAGIVVDVYAMDDGRGGAEPSQGVQHIAQDSADAYAAAAEDINSSDAQMVWLQHEFGIFGGRDGALIVDMLDQITVPVAITLHTILAAPSPNQRHIMDALVRRASMLIVMAEKGREILIERYGVAASKIRIIPHGIPDRPFVMPDSAKVEFGLEQRTVLLTFGLLSAEKGIGDMIEAMPAVIRACPNAIYVVLGATHPHVMAQSGTGLRDGLIARAAELGIENHIKFVDSYVDLDLLTRYLQAADVYVTPYHNPDQITSGTLSYAVGLGKPVVSTGYVHARELLGDGTGILVPFRDPAALGRAVSGLLTDTAKRDQMARRAYRIGRTMTWERYATAALGMFAQIGIRSWADNSVPIPGTPLTGMTALQRMTDDTGMFQHSRFGVADRHHGYCIDDNARALALVSTADDLPVEERRRLGQVYASFVQHAWNPDLGVFRNFMHYGRHWLEDQGSSDSNGRTLWALAQAATCHNDPMIREWAIELYRETSPRLSFFHSPRSLAFAVLAAVEMHEANLGLKGSVEFINAGGTELLSRLQSNRRTDWNWFESVLAYDNCRLPEALLKAGGVADNKAMISEALSSLDWVMRLQMADAGWFRPVGSTSFGKAYAKPMMFDQQPVEALAAIDACLAASRHDQQQKWLDWGESAYAWFTGENDLGVALADADTGECCDGLTPEGRNANRGAESVLAWQSAIRQIARLRRSIVGIPKPTIQSKALT